MSSHPDQASGAKESRSPGKALAQQGPPCWAWGQSHSLSNSVSLLKLLEFVVRYSQMTGRAPGLGPACSWVAHRRIPVPLPCCFQSETRVDLGLQVTVNLNNLVILPRAGSFSGRMGLSGSWGPHSPPEEHTLMHSLCQSV